MTIDLKMFFINSINTQLTNYNLITEYIIVKFNEYIIANTKNRNLFDCI